MNGEHLSTPGARIRLMRKAKGWKQEGFARELGASQASVSQWENDKWLPGPLMRWHMANVLGVSESFLFGDINDERVAS